MSFVRLVKWLAPFYPSERKNAENTLDAFRISVPCFPNRPKPFKMGWFVLVPEEKCGLPAFLPAYYRNF
jgi:hypothetical protein